MEKTSFKVNSKSILEEKVLEWNLVQKSFQKSFGEEVYSSWLKNISLLKEYNDYVILGVKTRFFRDWITSRYADRILSELKKYKISINRLEFKIEPDSSVNKTLFTKSDSREPEVSGVLGAIIGSFYCLFVAICISVPIGVFAAIFLQEFAKKNKITDFIEININNLAAVPSIVFGLLGLSVFINFFHLPRSSPIVGGLVLALMSLPTIVIVTRASLLAVPDTIRDGAIALGASKMQAIFNQVLPLATPGICTGIIIALARALGETAPLLMIGMIAFIPDTPIAITDPATALPAQIFMWADHPEKAFVERTSAAILILLSFLIVMNAAAIYIRHKFERKW